MSDYLDPNNEELLKDFFSEAQSQVDTLEQNILVLENESGNRDAVDEIFRAAHTLKGGAATVEMSELAGFTHLVEDVLDAIRSDAVTVEETVIDVLLASIDIIKAMLTERMEGRVYSEDVSRSRGAVGLLASRGFRRKKPKAKAAAPVQIPAPSAKAEESGKLSEYDLLELTQAAEPGKTVYRVAVTFNEDNVMNTVGGIQVFAALKDMGSVLRTVPDFEKLYEDTFYPVVEYYIASSRSVDDLKRRVSIPDVTLSADVSAVNAPAAKAPSSKAAASPAQKPAPAGAATPSVAAPRPSAAPPASKPASVPVPAEAAASAEEGEHSEAEKAQREADAKKAGKEAGAILRVDSKRIDNLLNLVSETVITKATFNQVSTQFGDLMTQLQSTESTYREKVKDLFDSLPDYLESIRQGAHRQRSPQGDR